MPLGVRLRLINWPVIVMDQQFRMLPGMMDPAKAGFYKEDVIVDVLNPLKNTNIAICLEGWAQAHGRGISVRCHQQSYIGRYSWTFGSGNTHCVRATNSQSSENRAMWDSFVPILVRQILPSVPSHEIAILVPYRAMLDYVVADLRERGIDIQVGRLESDNSIQSENGKDDDDDYSDDDGESSVTTVASDPPLANAALGGPQDGEHAPVVRRSQTSMAVGTIDSCKYCHFTLTFGWLVQLTV